MGEGAHEKTTCTHMAEKDVKICFHNEWKSCFLPFREQIPALLHRTGLQSKCNQLSKRQSKHESGIKKKTDSEIWDIFNNSESITLQSLW